MDILIKAKEIKDNDDKIISLEIQAETIYSISDLKVRYTLLEGGNLENNKVYTYNIIAVKEEDNKLQISPFNSISISTTDTLKTIKLEWDEIENATKYCVYKINIEPPMFNTNIKYRETEDTYFIDDGNTEYQTTTTIISGEPFCNKIIKTKIINFDSPKDALSLEEKRKIISEELSELIQQLKEELETKLGGVNLTQLKIIMDL